MLSGKKITYSFNFSLSSQASDNPSHLYETVGKREATEDTQKQR